ATLVDAAPIGQPGLYFRGISKDTFLTQDLHQSVEKLGIHREYFQLNVGGLCPLAPAPLYRMGACNISLQIFWFKIEAKSAPIMPQLSSPRDDLNANEGKCRHPNLPRLLEYDFLVFTPCF